jgi:D-arabinose 1-dehydrogenase-like Zn-dependent alcohol dehydrogenase
MLAHASALAKVPAALDPVESAPLLCAGITTFNALRHCGAKPGDLVAIHGVGGLGHLGIQFAARQGFRTVAVNRGRDKEDLARSLGAHAYIDSAANDPAQALQAMGGNAIASMNEIFRLEDTQAAYDRMMSGKARFRVVLKIDP